MKQDPIVDEVRKARESLFAKFGNNLDALVEHLQRKTKEGEKVGRVVGARRPRRAISARGTRRKAG